MGNRCESCKYPITAHESIMKPKAHGTSEQPVQQSLMYGVDVKQADNVCNFNRHGAEYSGYMMSTKWFDEVKHGEPVEYFDSVTGKRLFTAPVGRSFEEFLKESKSHGWPSFRDAEVDWDNVRVVQGNEAVSITGTHLGHNIPDAKGNRYCINLMSVAGFKK